MRVAVLQGGRSLERQVSLRSGARVAGRARAPGARGRGDRRRARPRRPAARRPRPTSRSSPCTGATARTGPSRSSSRRSGIPYTGSGVAACMRSLDKVTAKHLLRDAGRRHAGLVLVHARRPSRSSAPPTPWGRSRSASAFPIVVKPADQGSALGIRFARTPADVPGALVAAFSYSPKVLLERHVHGRELAVALLGDEALPVVEAIPRDEDFYDFSARYTIGRTRFVCPADLGRGRHRRGPGARGRGAPAARPARASPGSTSCSRRPPASSSCSRPTRCRA